MNRPPKHTLALLPAVFKLSRRVVLDSLEPAAVLEADTEYTIDHYAPWGPVTGDVTNALGHMVGANWADVSSINGCMTWEELEEEPTILAELRMADGSVFTSFELYTREWIVECTTDSELFITWAGLRAKARPDCFTHRKLIAALEELSIP